MIYESQPDDEETPNNKGSTFQFQSMKMNEESDLTIPQQDSLIADDESLLYSPGHTKMMSSKHSPPQMSKTQSHPSSNDHTLNIEEALIEPVELQMTIPILSSLPSQNNYIVSKVGDTLEDFVEDGISPTPKRGEPASFESFKKIKEFEEIEELKISDNDQASHDSPTANMAEINDPKQFVERLEAGLSKGRLEGVPFIPVVKKLLAILCEDDPDMKEKAMTLACELLTIEPK